MRRMKQFGMPLVAVVVVGLAVGVRSAAAQTHQAKGSVAAVTDSSLTVKAGERNLTFDVTAETKVEAPGAGRQTRQVQAAGGSGIRITDFVKAGKPVLVIYREANGRNQAVTVRPISSAGDGDTATSEAATKSEAGKTASGKVTAITASALTVNHNGKDMTFAVDTATMVSAKGAGRTARAAGGRVPITDLVGKGDTVSVDYRESGSTMNASQVRIQVKAH